MNDPRLCVACFATIDDENPGPQCSHCGWEVGSDRVSEDELPPGSLLRDRYQVGKVLGRGGFGITYLGFDRSLRRRRAIKEYFPRGILTRAGTGTRVTVFSGQKDLYQRGMEAYLSEAQLLAQFENHPCIVSPLDFFEENGTAYLVMEYLEGETLRIYVERNGGRLPFAHALYFMIPVLDALQAVHEAGITHRDVSPDNVFLTTQSQSKLIDFGAARHGLAARGGPATVIVRDHYAPPEQYAREGRAQGPWTDIYAAAATIYYALTGTSPPPGPERMLNDELQPPSALGAPMPKAGEAVLLQSLRLRPQERPQRVDLLRDALQAALAGGSGEQTRLARPGTSGGTFEVTADHTSRSRSGGGTGRSQAPAGPGLGQRLRERAAGVAAAVSAGVRAVRARGSDAASALGSVARHAGTGARRGLGQAASGLGAVAGRIGQGFARALARLRAVPLRIVGLGLAALAGVALLSAGGFWLSRNADSLAVSAPAADPPSQSVPSTPPPRAPEVPRDATAAAMVGEPSNSEPTSAGVDELSSREAVASGAPVELAAASEPGPGANTAGDAAAAPPGESAVGPGVVDGESAATVAMAPSGLEPDAAPDDTTIAPPEAPEIDPADEGTEARASNDTPSEAGAAPRDPAPAADRPIEVMVRSNVSEDELWIDGERVGQTGPRRHALAPGKHTIRVSKQGYTTEEQVVNLRPGSDPRTLRFNLARAVSPDAERFSAALSRLDSPDRQVRLAALDTIRSTASNGYARAQEYLGSLYARGDYVEADDEQALRWYRKAAEAGIARAQYMLGLRLEYGRWNPFDEEAQSEQRTPWIGRIFDFFSQKRDEQKRAFIEELEKGKGDEFGGPEVQGDPADFPEAMRWYSRAATQGIAGAQERAGFMQASGRGTDRNVIVAFRKWFMLAAQNGRPDAQYVVGMCYSLGIGIPDQPSNRSTAECWLRKAAAQGQSDARQQLESMQLDVASQPPPTDCRIDYLP